MPSTCPRVRNACENCHKKKIRCLLQPDREACQNCSASRSQCLFAPRVKTGRPRLARTASGPQQSPFQCDDLETLLQLQNESPHDFQDMSLPGSGQCDTTLVFKEQSNSNSTLSMHGAREAESLAQQAVGLHNYSNDRGSIWAEHKSQDSLLDPWTTPLTTAPETPSSTLSNMAITFPSTPSHLSENLEPGFDFSSYLQLCTNLDRQCHLLREANYSTTNLHDVLSTIGPACTTAIKTISSTSASALASSALVLAGVYKVFQICETIIRHASSGTLGPQAQTLDHLLLLKILDLALLQGKDFLTRTGHGEAAKKAGHMHCCLEMLVKEQDQCWA